MTRFVEGEERSQDVLFPERLEDWISEDNPVRVVDAFVDELDLKALGFERATAAQTGRPGYHPATLLKIYVYGYLNRIASSRRLEREAQRNVELMWLTRRLAPDFKTIADFRRDNGAAIRKVCAQFVLLCRRLNLFSEAIVAIDGSKFKAVNNRDKNFTKHKLKARMAQLEESVARYLDELDRADRQPGQVPRVRVDNLKGKIAKIREQMRQLGRIEEQLKDAPDEQISQTDPDARSMATSGRGTGIVGYNVQTAVDTKNHMVVAHDVLNVGHDRTALADMSRRAREAMGKDRLLVLADRGYFSGEQIVACEQDGNAPVIPKPLTSGAKFEGRFDKRDFIYDAKRDAYRCPAGKLAIYRFTRLEDGLAVRRYWSSDCRSCHLKPQCTPAPERKISRWEHEEVLERMQQRVNYLPMASQWRRETAEHVFGTLKSWMGPAHFLTKRLRNVRTEISLQVLAYNMKRAMQILGVPVLLRAMQA
jgi:transposase